MMIPPCTFPPPSAWLPHGSSCRALGPRVCLPTRPEGPCKTHSEHGPPLLRPVQAPVTHSDTQRPCRGLQGRTQMWPVPSRTAAPPAPLLPPRSHSGPRCASHAGPALAVPSAWSPLPRDPRAPAPVSRTLVPCRRLSESAQQPV